MWTARERSGCRRLANEYEITGTESICPSRRQLVQRLGQEQRALQLPGVSVNVTMGLLLRARRRNPSTVICWVSSLRLRFLPPLRPDLVSDGRRTEPFRTVDMGNTAIMLPRFRKFNASPFNAAL
eukprot:COSAG03_NODE_1669_length_3685_cov_3.006414_3_plen_125_part_00